MGGATPARRDACFETFFDLLKDFCRRVKLGGIRTTCSVLWMDDCRAAYRSRIKIIFSTTKETTGAMIHSFSSSTIIFAILRLLAASVGIPLVAAAELTTDDLYAKKDYTHCSATRVQR